MVDRGGTRGCGGIYHIVLCQMPLADECESTHQLTLAVVGGNRVSLDERLDTHYVVGTLVADNLCGG